ncbi:branched-chain alpha-keto acid dehydrogenase subunit E2 [Burkholderia puraquae]|uniref:Dihydrolipoamide acetyltransferase component of pyruvate dehydrogenase complex n=2 Tax=Burkholderia cepacia complex TaxID=87882 RepID=A0A1X1PEX8_9BURK|nr:dihydrolipoamide acetyltransferase family protein [Burkholderia puraquae]ORT84616.1 branched-chain alpha-keto acid dehydrogenase subunit E2 [Burkholderia puraquae]CAB3761922.1 Lipoamide acyltransferase component of branched-chain alpha-keto acid dehydrogenase complex [Burkholderia puraquae]
MGIHVIKMPDIGEGIAEVELVAWHVEVGQTIREDQPLADVMTDKAAVEIPSPVTGKVIELGGRIGEMMAVGSELIRLEVEGDGNLKAGAPVRESKVETSPVAAAPSKAVAEAPAESPARPAAKHAPAEPRRAKHAEHTEHTEHTEHVGLPRAALAAGERPLASPAVRQRAWDMGIELRYVRGTGEAGRILHADLDAYARTGSGAARGSRGSQAHGYDERNDETEVPVIGLRRAIARKMQEAKRRIPHFSYVEEIDVTELESLRTELNRRHGDTRGKLTPLPLLIRAMVIALRDFPQINARFDDEAGVVTRYGAVHMGVATQTDGGLTVPVLRHAEARDVWSISAEIARLADAVRANRAQRDELSGSTITISSLGALGGIVSTPVINHPEVGIVGVNRIVERPMIRDGAVVARKMMNLSSSFDHRVVDGADAAEFIQAVRAVLERPALLFVE